MRFAQLAHATLNEATFDDVDLRCVTLPANGLDAPMRLSVRLHVAMITMKPIGPERFEVLSMNMTESTKGNRVHSWRYFSPLAQACGCYFDVTVVSRSALAKVLEICEVEQSVLEVWTYEGGDTDASLRWPDICGWIHSSIAMTSAVAS